VSVPPPAAATVLAFDFGTRRIGVAVGNTVTRHAHPLTTIAAEANAERFAAIAALVREWQPARLVVGLPVHADGTEHDMTARARRFARQLEGRLGLPVVLVDERWTSAEARTRLREVDADRRDRREARDQVAAQLILQAHLDDDRRPA
jgi:putative Holliday junction resolvase